MNRISRAMTVALLAGAPPWGASADEKPAARLEELIVYGRAEQRIGTAHAASEGVVGYADIQLPPLLRVGELVEVVPGMVATQHSGTGKANQYFLRGFNLDHGTDFSAAADGVPLNMRSHGHGQGYLDLNFLIPELVETASYQKGPYDADVGDFSSAGSVAFSFYDRLPDRIASLTLGEDSYGRGLLAGSSELGAGTLTGAASAIRYDGPWQLDEDLEQNKFYLAYARPLGTATARVALQGYDGEWDATDQIPQRAVRSGLIDELGFIDPDLGGATERYSLSATVDFPGWQISGYAIDYDFELFSDFTYQLEDPVLGDEFEQRDRRQVYGLNLTGERRSTLAGRPLNLRWGGDLRHDDVREVGLYRTSARQRTGTVRRDSLDETSVGGFVEAELALFESLRGIAGLRADYYDWDVSAQQEQNSGSGDDQLVSPNLGLAWRASDAVEVYASWGRGFHSNDVRGATISVDPVSGEPVDPVPVLSKSDGMELGIRFEPAERFNATVVGFQLDLDSELVYVGDAGTTEANDGTRRRGVETALFWEAAEWLAVNAAYTFTDAEFRQDQGGGVEIPGAVESTFTLGLNAHWHNGWTASARLRYLGEAPLVEDDSVRADDSLLVNAAVGYRRGPLELRLEAFNLLDSDDADISYFYASRLPGEPAAGVEDLHFHPLEPRSLRGSVTMHW